MIEFDFVYFCIAVIGAAGAAACLIILIDAIYFMITGKSKLGRTE